MKDLPYEVVIGKNNHYMASDWCQARFGKRWEAIGHREGTWCCFWAGTRGDDAGKYRYHFQFQEDAVFFALKWQQDMKNELTQRWVASICAPPRELYEGWRPCINWCKENFESKSMWTYEGEGVFEFESEQEYLLFMLRWA